MNHRCLQLIFYLCCLLLGLGIPFLASAQKQGSHLSKGLQAVSVNVECVADSGISWPNSPLVDLLRNEIDKAGRPLIRVVARGVKILAVPEKHSGPSAGPTPQITCYNRVLLELPAEILESESLPDAQDAPPRFSLVAPVN